MFYDKPLADAVKQFQKEKGLPATGTADAATVDALNGKRHERDDHIIIANMERWRWMPRDLGKAHVVLEHSGLHAAGLQRRRSDLDDAGRGRQARHTRRRCCPRR